MSINFNTNKIDSSFLLDKNESKLVDNKVSITETCYKNDDLSLSLLFKYKYSRPGDSKLKNITHKIEREISDIVVKLTDEIPALGKLGYSVTRMFTKPDGDSDDKRMGNVGYLNSNLMRGSQPLEEDIISLKKQGVKTIINLRPDEDWEKPIIQKNGMKEIYLPLPALGKPSNQDAIKFLSIVTDKNNGKVFFHCLHGADRTGAMAAVYRIANDGWTAKKAIDEMYKYNFHSGAEDSKLDFVNDFEVFWKNLPTTEKNHIIHK